MIIKSGDQSILKRLPFAARFNEEEMTVSFSEGFIIDCYSENFSGKEMKQGSAIYRPKNMDDEFQVEEGDSFYLEIKEDLNESNIFKVTRQIRKVFEEDGGSLKEGAGDVMPIWFSKTDKEPSRQFLTENVFLQDIKKSRKWGFQLKKGETKDGETEYILYGGFLMCPNQEYSKFHETQTFKIPEEEKIFLYIEIDVSVEVSNEKELQKANTVEIKSARVIDSKIIKRSEELSEDDIFNGKIRIAGGSLNKTEGKYYILLPRKGNVEAYFSAFDPDFAGIEPLLYTQVRGGKEYKNGVSTQLISGLLLSEISEDEQGYYKSITIVEKYTKFIVKEEEDEEGNFVSFIEETGSTHDITTEFYVDGESLISESEPIILTDTSEPELGEDEFYIRPKVEDEYSFGGSEISDSAYGALKAKITEMDFVDIGKWSGDSTVVLFGAGKDGTEQKTLPTVVHAERKYKKIGQISETKDITGQRPASFQHYALILDTEGESEDDIQPIGYDDNEGVYISKEWTEIEIKDDGVYTKELLYSECEVQENFGEYHNIEFTKDAFDYYQELIMSTV